MKWKDFRAAVFPSIARERISGESRERPRNKRGEERRRCLCWKGSRRPSGSSLLSILPVFVASDAPTLSVSPSLIVSPVLDYSPLMLSFLSPSRRPSSPHPPFFFLLISHTRFFPTVVCLKACLLFQFNFHLTFLCFPPPIYPLLFSFLILPFSFTWPRSLHLFPPLSLSLSLLRLCCRAPLAHTNFRLITVITSINERGLSS